MRKTSPPKSMEKAKFSLALRLSRSRCPCKQGDEAALRLSISLPHGPRTGRRVTWLRAEVPALREAARAGKARKVRLADSQLSPETTGGSGSCA